MASNLLLQSIIKQCKDKWKDGVVAFLDFRKAFDSIFHDSLITAARRWGPPSTLVAYISDLYRKATTTILGDETSINRGVLQGDPLSPLLFNITLDWALEELSQDLGIEVNGNRISNIAYADDVALIATTKIGMQIQLNALKSAAQKVGLELGPAKCATLFMKGDKKRKKWLVNARHQFMLGETAIRSLEPDETFKYLELEVGPNPRKREPRQAHLALKEELVKLQAAPLKPQQKLWAIKNTTFPRHIYKRVLGSSKKYLLLRFDLEMRRFLKKALHLPSDTPSAYFHSNTKDGGLGIPSFAQEVPVL